jgi:diguanylate cyclase (GGDEF)-like protein
MRNKTPTSSTEILKLKEDIMKLKKQVNFYRYDQLTGLKTRNDLEYDFNYLLHKHQNFIIHLCDINNLKSINTKYGYVVGGDALIKKVVQKLKLFFDHNYIYRIGGDEFIIFDFNLTEFNDSVNDLTCVSEVIEAGSYMNIGTEQEILNLKKIISKMDKNLRKKKASSDRRGHKQEINVKNKLDLSINILNYEPVFLKINGGEMLLKHSDEQQLVYLKEKEEE